MPRAPLNLANASAGCTAGQGTQLNHPRVGTCCGTSPTTWSKPNLHARRHRELYFFRRARANLPAPPVSLLAAVTALTNQTLIRATFRPPLLLLHTAEDLLEPAVTLKHPPAIERLRQARFAPHVLYLDRDWDCLQPQRYSRDSWHFYRHSFAAWNLTGWEALEATALAGQTRFTVRRRQVVFELDMRPRVAPRVESYPP